MTVQISTENERKWMFERKFQNLLSDGWIFVQGHWNGGRDNSVRVIPACNSAFLRSKSATFGSRDKSSEKISLAEGIRLLKSMPETIALKTRFLVPDGRAWLVDYFPELDKYQAETEFDTIAEMYEPLDEVPPFLLDDITYDESAYTRNMGRMRTSSEIDDLLSYAMQNGCRQDYDPDQIFGGMIPADT